MLLFVRAAVIYPDANCLIPIPDFYNLAYMSLGEGFGCRHNIQLISVAGEKQIDNLNRNCDSNGFFCLLAAPYV